jgi:hypothetical protein
MYKIEWVDEEEMEMNAGVELLERSVALGRSCGWLLWVCGIRSRDDDTVWITRIWSSLLYRP